VKTCSLLIERGQDAAVPRYHFHLQLDDRLILDKDGVDLPDPKAEWGENACAVRERWENVLGWMPRLPHRTTIVTDEDGRVLFVLAL
jgi:hypothetical protein